jgi:hypothetical protein
MPFFSWRSGIASISPETEDAAADVFDFDSLVDKVMQLRGTWAYLSTLCPAQTSRECPEVAGFQASRVSSNSPMRDAILFF